MEKRNTMWKQDNIKPNVTYNQKTNQTMTGESSAG